MYRPLHLFASSIVLFAFAFCGCNESSLERTTSNDAFVDSILFSLSLEYKVGEMTQLTLGAIGTGKPSELD